MEPKFKAGDILVMGEDVLKVEYVYDSKNTVLKTTNWYYNLRILASSTGRRSHTFDSGCWYIDSRYTKDNTYLATKQFDKELEDLLNDT